MKPSVRRRIRSLASILRRNVFLLTNGVIAAVVGLLFVFGDPQAGLFLGLVLFVNIALGLAQDIHAWLALENLELLTAPRIARVNDDGTEESVLVEAILRGDRLKLKTGDQVPCDGTLLDSQTLEVNEGLITGESASLPRHPDERLLAGSIVTAGAGTLRADTLFRESHLARMTEGLRDYTVSESPIQKAVGIVVRAFGYALLPMILFVIGRGLLVGTPHIVIVKNIGALASMLVPQGLVFAMTLLFSYGALHLYRRDVLLQEVNATEKLGRIKNLCLDKTGTLSENHLTAEDLRFPADREPDRASNPVAAYLDGSGDPSQTIAALRKRLPGTFDGALLASLPFSSWRGYGAVRFAPTGGEAGVVVAGAPERLLPRLASETDRVWLQTLIATESRAGKRLLGFALAPEQTPLDSSEAPLTLVAVAVFSHQLRPGIRTAIDFFQRRGVRLRIISGDHLETVRAVAREAGVRDTEHGIDGSALAALDAEAFARAVRQTTVFARILPEQKGRIIETLKQSGFTAMVGDGANDALAIKRADLGIAMFEGAPATRQLASVILTRNSFTALPGGVALADSIIRNAEIFASIFFDTAFAGFFLFFIVSLLGVPFPLTPLNITLINYFTVGLPGLLVTYWTLRPSDQAVIGSSGDFLRAVLPFVAGSAFLQALAMGAAFLVPPGMSAASASSFPVLLMTVLTGYAFFLFVPSVYRGRLLPAQACALWGLALGEAVLFVLLLRLPFAVRFFEIDFTGFSRASLVPCLALLAAYVASQSVLTRYFVKRRAARIT